jgi:hypothetical protein
MEMFQVKFAEEIKTRTLCLKTFFRKFCRLQDNVEKYGTPDRLQRQFNTAHSLCVLGT